MIFLIARWKKHWKTKKSKFLIIYVILQILSQSDVKQKQLTWAENPEIFLNYKNQTKNQNFLKKQKTKKKSKKIRKKFFFMIEAFSC